MSHAIYDNPHPPDGWTIAAKDPSGEAQPVLVDAQGLLRVSVSGAGSGGTSSSFGATFPAAGTAAGALNDNTGFMEALKVNDNGELLVAQAGGGSAVSIADGSDVAEGATTDTAVTGDNAGTVSAKLRGINKIVADVWDSVTHALGVKQIGTWSVTANAGTNLNTSALALESGGNLAAAAASLAVMDDWDESDRAKVNLIAGQAGIAGGTGVDGATVPRVTLATNVALPAGTNAIGKLAANSGVDIGDVDVTSVGGNVTVVQSTASNLNATVVGTGTFAVQAAQSTATNLKTQAECYQGGTAVSSSAPLQVTLANTGTNATAVTVTHGKTIKSASGSFTSDTDIIAAVTSKRIKVIGYAFFTFGTNATVLLLKSNGTGGTLLWTVAVQAVTSSVMGANMAVSAPSFIFATAAGEKLTADTNQTDTVYWSISYFDDDAT